MRDQAIALRTAGLSYRAIAGTLGISRSTIRYWCASDYAEKERRDRRRRYEREAYWHQRGVCSPGTIPYAVFLAMLGGEW